MADTIRVTGLKEFSANLRKMDRDLPKGLRIALNDVADIVVTATRPKIPRRTGRAAASLKAQSTRTEARIAVGGPKAPYYPWLDFGGRVGRKHATVRPFFKEGRYIYPTLSAKRAEVTEAMRKALVGLAQSSGIEVT